MTDHYKCARCEQTFKKGWSDAKAEKELAETYGVNKSNCDLVCDDCYQLIKPISYKELRAKIRKDQAVIYKKLPKVMRRLLWKINKEM